MAGMVDPVLLRLECGTCNNVLDVSAVQVKDLLDSKTYRCPVCLSFENIEIEPKQENFLLLQAEHSIRQMARVRAAEILAHQHAARHAARQPSFPQQNMNHHLRNSRSVLTSTAGTRESRFNRVNTNNKTTYTGESPQTHHHNMRHHVETLVQSRFPNMENAGRNPLTQAQMVESYYQHLNRQLYNQSNIKKEHTQSTDAYLQEFFLEDEEDEVGHGEARDTFMEYSPSKLKYGSPHPDPVVETSSLASVESPDITYDLKAKSLLLKNNRLSALQLEAVVYACQRHEQWLPGRIRAGFFLGDGAGVGKGRTLAGMILENWHCGRKRHLWVSIGPDLKYDAKRDLDDIGASGISLHPLNKIPYGKIDGKKINIQDGIIFLTYSSLVSSSDKGLSRLKQLVQWCREDFEGLIIFDESHKAKNLVPDAITRSTQIGLKVKEIQDSLPGARVVYCSATGASEPRNMGYMVRLGLWGNGHSAFPSFTHFLDAMQGRSNQNLSKSNSNSVAKLELLAMDMKAQGMYVCRTLSFIGADFATVNVRLEEKIVDQYRKAAKIWTLLLREFTSAEKSAINTMEKISQENGIDLIKKGILGGSMLWRAFWASHQRFFRHLCMAAKVNAAVEISQVVLKSGKCVVIGLQSTGESRTADVVADKGDDLDDFVSGPKELLLRLVDLYYPLPLNSKEYEKMFESETDEDYDGWGVKSACNAAAKGLFEKRNKFHRRSASDTVRYKEYDEEEGIGMTSSEDEFRSDTDTSSSEYFTSCTSSFTSDDSKAGDFSQVLHQASDGALNHTSSQLRENGYVVSRKDQDNENTHKLPVTNNSSEFMHRNRTNNSAQGHDGESENTGNQCKIDQNAMLEQLDAAFKKAEDRKNKLKKLISDMELPPNPLDELIDRLGGPDSVAEMTGRKGRLVRDIKTGGVRYEARNASGVMQGSNLESININERELFLNGTKLIAIISEAASAGISLHADRRVENQLRRVHLTLELPWSADKAIQQFGRSHRANQAHGPQYRLIFTPLGGERRFAAAVAKRLESLGALTQGDRRAGPSLAAFNYESLWGQTALREMYSIILGESQKSSKLLVPMESHKKIFNEKINKSTNSSLFEFFCGQVRASFFNVGLLKPKKDQMLDSNKIDEWMKSKDGIPEGILTVEDKDRSDVPKFLNRLLGLPPAAQAKIFDYYQGVVDEIIALAKKEGNLDEGIVDVRAHSIKICGSPRKLSYDPISKAYTVLYSIEIDRGHPFDECFKLLEGVYYSPEIESGALLSTTVTSIPNQGLAGKRSKGPESLDSSGISRFLAGEIANGTAESCRNNSKIEVSKLEGVENGCQQTVIPESDGGKNAKYWKNIMKSNDGSSTLLTKSKRQKFDKRDCNFKGTDSEKRSQPIRNSASEVEKYTANCSENDTNIDYSELLNTPNPKLVSGKDNLGTLKKSTGKTSSDKELKSGFYRARHATVSGHIHVLLALRIPGTSPASFKIYRPATGKSQKAMSMADLNNKYRIVDDMAEAKKYWDILYELASKPVATGKMAVRFKTIYLLTGAVIRHWHAVQNILDNKSKNIKSKLRVLRIETTGDTHQRLVGMEVPAKILDDIINALSPKENELNY